MDEDSLRKRVSQPAHLGGMYRGWFLDYASYVILERAVPHIADGLKPVQRRILHAMKRLDDGRFNKVANIVGQTMQFHPHGDASIKDALVQLGQKDLLIDCQGNWGNIITGDDAAAARYIEARLSRFALDVVFNPKTTEWKLSYDGRQKEPVTLPVKFPLLLAQGSDGIAVGLNSKILPHNFSEICDAAVSLLHGEEFHLYPDFPTGGSVDISRYNDGRRGGTVRVRAKIEKRDAKTLAITEIPFGKTTGTASRPSSFVDSILRASEKGKIKIRRVEDLTAARAEILIHLAPGASPDKTIDALYACTDCEVSISPNCCVIADGKPCFLGVSDVLSSAVHSTMELLRRERLIRKGELTESLHYATLEQIFIEQRIYKDKEFEQSRSNEEACQWVEQRLEPWLPKLIRPLTRDDTLRLLEIKMQRILRFSSDKAERFIRDTKKEMARIDRELASMVEVTADFFRSLREKYGELHPRLTEIKSFDNISAARVVERNSKLYVNRAEGFIGTSLRKDELVGECSDIDDIIIFYRDGTYKVVRVADKLFVGETLRSKAEGKRAEILHLAVFKRNDSRTVYNAVYQRGKDGPSFIKRFAVTGVVLGREYDLTQGHAHSRVLYLSANPNGEAEVIRVAFRPSPLVRKLTVDRDFSSIAVKGRQAMGNLLAKLPIQRITLVRHGASTLAARQVWYEADVGRLNYEGRGLSLGEFSDSDHILVLTRSGMFRLSSTDVANHYEGDILRIEKFSPEKVWTACVQTPTGIYIKRFTLSEASSRPRSFLTSADEGEEAEVRTLLLLTDSPSPTLALVLREGEAPLEVRAEEFVAVKGYKAKGKRITTLPLVDVQELIEEQEQEEDIAVEDRGEDFEQDIELGGDEEKADVEE